MKVLKIISNLDVSVSVCYGVYTSRKNKIDWFTMKPNNINTLEQEQLLPASPADKLLTIGDLAKACNTTVRSLRYYEELDLITPESRSTGGYRLYVSATIKRVNAILALQALNYSLEEITALLGKASEGLSSTTRKRRVAFTQTTLVNQTQTVAEKLTTLQAMQAELAQRLTVLTTHCVPCAEAFPDTDCCETCPHSTIHWN